MKRIICFAFAVLFIIFAFPFTASAASMIDSSDCYTDLKTMGVDLTLYKPSEDDDNPKVITLLEHGYSGTGNFTDYGLYLYVYNPAGDKILKFSQYNTLQLVIKNDSGVVVFDRKIKLLYLSSSTSKNASDAADVYYKFKLDLPAGFVNNYVSKTKRQYGVVDVELQYSGEVNPRLINVSNTYIYTGYQAYYGPKDDGGNVSDRSTLYCVSNTLETISVELHPASWKTVSSDKGVGYQYEVSSVYFSIPDFYLEKYGNMEDEEYKGLHAVSGEWYEYKINGLATNNHILYDAAKKEEAETYKLNNYFTSSSVMGTSATNTIWYSSRIPFGFPLVHLNGSVKGYNFAISDTQPSSSVYLDALLNSFYFSGDSVFISSDKILDEVFDEDIFYVYSSVDSGRKFGHNEYHIKTDDAALNDLIRVYATAGNSKIMDFLCGRDDFYADELGYPEIKPIKMVSNSDVSGLDKPVGDLLFVSEEDVSGLRSFTTDSTKEGKTTYLMRFAVTDYFCEKLSVYYSGTQNTYAGDHYFFEKTIFHNFDIMEFTFKNSEGEYTVIPVSSKPIDVVGTITPPVLDGGIFDDLFGDDSGDGDGAGFDWVKLILLVFGVFIVFVVLYFLLKLIGPIRESILKNRSINLKNKKDKAELKEERRQRRLERKAEKNLKKEKEKKE